MPYIDPKYEQLSLTDTYLTDPLLLALAWKKAHEYIRTLNWYADNFELDRSALNLAELCDTWSEELKKAVSFFPLELVPAPKSAEWVFNHNEQTNHHKTLTDLLDETLDDIGQPCYCLNWEPKKSDGSADETKGIKLRPLAHIGIKEQTFMTLVMMCLANDVEALQGDPSVDYQNTHDKKVVSYGNRLYCTYHEDGKAEYNYGATATYGKFFTDYRKFLQRPYYFAAKALPEKSQDEEIYLIELDLSQFFDLISRKILIEKIKNFSKNQQNSESVNHLFNAFNEWAWSEEANKNYQLCKTDKVEKPPMGLPQGLVASGFLSNIYMLDFDCDISESIGKIIPTTTDHQLKLIDYCRYVDDMRFVVVGPSRDKFSNPTHTIQKNLNEWVEKKLKTLQLQLNTEKTKVDIFRGKSKGISTALEEIQNRGSGPVSHEDAEELVSQLEALLLLSGEKTPKQDGSHCRINRLALIEKSVFDVREDTLKRFAANKISRLLNNIRHFTARDTDDNGNAISGDWDYLQERMARRLIACWSRDPALVLLLKKGLELFPSPKLLIPILEQLRVVINKADNSDAELKKQSAVALYCLAEIFRHSCMVIHRKDPNSIPAHANIEGYFEYLQDYAATLLHEEKYEIEFNFLLDQARFLLMTRLDSVLEKSSGNPEQDLIFKLAKGFRNIEVKKLNHPLCIATCILIASQLVGDLKPVIRATSCLLDSISEDNVKEVLDKIALQNPILLKAIILHARPLSYKWDKNPCIKILSDKLYLDVKPSAKPLSEIKEAVAIYKLSSRPDNPFANEIMSLKLMLGLIEQSKQINPKNQDQIIDLSRTKVALTRASSPTDFLSYSVPPVFEVFNCVIKVKKLAFQEPLYSMAKHLKCDKGEAAYLQKIALAIRAILIGSTDATGFGQSFELKPSYRGIKSTSFKRQFAMLTTTESLVGENAQFSAWLTTLLAKLLRWPGIHINDQGFEWPINITLEAVKKLIDGRLDTLKNNYCQLSGMPGITELITPNWDKNKKSLTVAMVQSKLPFKKDFTNAGLLLDDTHYRVKHRRHVARIAQLVVKHIEAQNLEKPSTDKPEQNFDLIVWPELSVHADDIDILIQLSRKTHAIILAGLTFINQPGIKGPNNCAVWITPRKHGGNQNEFIRYQGKCYMMEAERNLKIQSWRPYQLMLELKHPKFKDKQGFVLSSAICFDATDIRLSADLRDKSNAFIVPALNQDVSSFDTMVEALHYHMYQPVILVNTGEFGGSYAMAPYKDQHKRLIAHSTGNNQVAINTFEMNMFDFRRDGIGKSMTSDMDTKTPPAGIPLKDQK